MPAKTYIPTPITAYQFDPKNTTELEKLGLKFDENKTEVTGPAGNTRQLNQGDYISIDSSGDMRVFSQEYFESRYTEFTSTAAKK